MVFSNAIEHCCRKVRFYKLQCAVAHSMRKIRAVRLQIGIGSDVGVALVYIYFTCTLITKLTLNNVMKHISSSGSKIE